MDSSPHTALFGHSPCADQAENEPASTPSLPLFIGLSAAAAAARLCGGALASMLQAHATELEWLEQAARCDEQALELCGRLLGLVLDADNGRDLHALVRLRRGLRLARAWLQLGRSAPVSLVQRLRGDDPDLRTRLDGRWVDIDLRPRRTAAADRPRYRVRLEGSRTRLERVSLG
ncbi:MAG: hypothetical protein MEQ07_01670 [Aquimonas sp.]|nr:hypothetical protein [Aquimonas sp.]